MCDPASPLPDAQAAELPPNPSLTSVSITSLPSELIRMILEHLVARSVARPPEYPKAWHSLPKVNSYIRSIALQMPHYWNVLSFKHEGLLDAMLRRSSGTLLEIVFDDQLHDLRNRRKGKEALAVVLLRKVLAEGPRIGSLKIICGPDTLRVCSQDLERVQAIRLAQCIIHCHRAEHELGQGALSDDAPEAITLPINTLSANQIPRLHTLSLTGVNLPWTSPLLGQSLEFLVLTAPSVLQGTNDMLNAFARMPKLRYLMLMHNLQNTGTHNSSQPPAYARERVKLPDLRHFVLSASVRDVTTLIRAVSLPQDVVLSITCEASNPSADIDTALHDLSKEMCLLHARNTQHGPPPCPLAVHICVQTAPSSNALRVSTSSQRQPDLMTARGPTAAWYTEGRLADFSVCITIVGLQFQDLHLAADTLLQSVGWTRDAVELVVEGGTYDVSEPLWLIIGELAPSVDTLVLHGHGTAASFLRTFVHTNPTRNTHEGPGTCPLLPQLQRLSLTDIDLLEDFLYIPLRSAIQKRLHSGKAIRALRVQGSNVAADLDNRLSELQKYVQHPIIIGVV